MNTALTGPPAAGEVRRLHFEVRGLVQGVGFRPQVLRIARSLHLDGWVRNHGAGVSIEVQGRRAAQFAARLRADLPPLARIDCLEERELPVEAATRVRGFHITESRRDGRSGPIPADAGICDDCLRELFDAGDRRHLHPFIACSNCGPRYSMTTRLPYDRCNTTMAVYDQCPQCRQEYEDPRSRRLHAEPIACHDCGPRLSHGIAAITRALQAGAVIALKGIGGYHLLCDARNAAAIRRLRERKQRPSRPLAVMALNTASIEREVVLCDAARRQLRSAVRPIVVAERVARGTAPRDLAPGVNTLGVMLPYTPLHYLLFHRLLGAPGGRAWLEEAQAPLLVFTSANRSGDPMVWDNARAETELGDIADLIVHHDRRISHACDDSLLRDVGDGTVLLRRARGLAPAPVPVSRPHSLAPGRPPVQTLALGAHLKNTVCALRGDQAFFSSHIGDLASPATQALLHSSASDLVARLDLDPVAVACDLHPDFASTRLAQALAASRSIPLLRVQHHHAHIAATLAVSEHAGPVLGIALDGHGLGTDGGAWGGEALRVDGASCERLGHFARLAMPGGDRAAREPWRLAAAWLRHDGDAIARRFGDRPLASAVASLAASDDCPRSSAAGRYFDLAAALLGVCTENRFEAQAPMMLEALCERPGHGAGLFEISDGQLSLEALLCELAACDDPRRGAALFHGVLIDALDAWIRGHCEGSGLDVVALSGGCFANRWLATGLPSRLRAAGLRVLTGWDRVPPGDGGISLGQAWVAAHRAGNRTE